MSPREAVAKALVLAVLVDDDALARRALDLAAYLAEGLSDASLEAAKQLAEEELCST
jgi:enoyl-CoA hydratase/carnithine racemase